MSFQELSIRISIVDSIEEKVKAEKETSDLGILYDLFIEYVEMVSEVETWSGGVDKDKSDLEFGEFSNNWNGCLNSTCSDLNGSLMCIQGEFETITSITKDLHMVYSLESPNRDAFELQARAQISLNNKVINYNRTKYLFILENALTHHKSYLESFGKYMKRESGNRHMW
jgi:hypothetical protein